MVSLSNHLYDAAISIFIFCHPERHEESRPCLLTSPLVGEEQKHALSEANVVRGICVAYPLYPPSLRIK
jgi:hypothetical protein